jgi:hypothetical protein
MLIYKIGFNILKYISYYSSDIEFVNKLEGEVWKREWKQVILLVASTKGQTKPRGETFLVLFLLSSISQF